MFRTYVLTGWLVFPFPLMDIFDTDFKMPTALVSFYQLEISMCQNSLEWKPNLRSCFHRCRGFPPGSAANRRARYF
jgi:hypothetical protein